MVRLLVGARTAEAGGEAAGIGLVYAGAPDDHLAGGSLTAAADAARVDGSPTWLARHPALDVVYAALSGRGAVQAFSWTGPDSLRALGRPVAVGDAPAHLAVAPGGGALVVACAGDGRVVRLTIAADGTLADPHAAPAAVDPYGDRVPAPAAADPDLAAAARALRAVAGAEFAHLVPDYGHEDRTGQPLPPGTPLGAPEGTDAAGDRSVARSSRAGAVRFLPGGLVAATDAGLDQVRLLGAGLDERGRVALPFGSAPAHTAWHPSGRLYVVTERSNELFALDADAAGRWRVVAGTPVSAGLPEADAAAGLALSPDGRSVYVPLRGTETIAVVRVGGDGARLSPVALVEAGVTGAGHPAVLRDTILLAGRDSHEIASSALDERTGVPGRVRHRVATPSPAHLLPMR